MNREIGLLELLDDIIEKRIENRSLNSYHQAKFIEANADICKFMEGITDDNIRNIIIRYEELKNYQVGMVVAHMYKEGLKDAITIFRLILKLIFVQEL